MPPKNVVKFVLIALMCFVTLIAQTGASFSDGGNSTSNTFTAGCWETPATVSLTSPADTSSTNTADVTFTWGASSSSCPTVNLEYKIQVYTDAGLTTLAFPDPGYSISLSYTYLTIPEGTYYWRVVAHETVADTTSTSGVYSVIVDRTAPAAALEITGSGYKAVEEKIVNGGLETGDSSGYTTAGTVNFLTTDSVTNMASGGTYTVTPYDGTYMAQVGRTNNYVWQNRLMQSFDTGAKSLSLYYNFFTRDTAGFDDPGFFIRVNGQEVFSKSAADLYTGVSDAKARKTDWQEFTYNLSHITDTSTNLAIYAGNTGDTTDNSWVYIDKITTYIATTTGTADYKFTGTDNVGGAGISDCSYDVDGGGWNSVVSGGDTPSFLTVAGTYTLTYRCTDNAGNNSTAQIVKVITDTTAPNAVVDLAVSVVTENTATLTWTAPGNDGATGRASEYDVRYSLTNITNDTEFEAATKNTGVPAPKTSGSTETLEVLGLDPGSLYYFAVRTYDEAPNPSSISNVPSDTTVASVVSVNPGDIVINEIMWSGTGLSTADEWVELRNMTGRVLDISGFVLTRWNGTSDVTMVTIPAGKTIAANGYFLISNFVDTASRLKNGITVDVVDTGVNLSNTALSIKLYTSGGSTLIDSAWNQTTVQEGILSAASGKYYSMERTSIPGDGTSKLNWYTCIDEASHADFFEGVADERGTPRAANRSENEPLSRAITLIDRQGIVINYDDIDPLATPSPVLTEAPVSPVISLTISENMQTASFVVENIGNYRSLNYTLSYDTDTTTQGVVGTVELDNQDTYTKSDIILGTCSTGGVCVYYSGIENMKLSIELTDQDGQLSTIEKAL